MNKKILTSSIISFCALFVYFTKSSAHNKVHDNYLYFTHDAHSINFIVKNHCIASGQSYQTPDGSQADKTPHGVGIDIKAGRHASSTVVDCIDDIFDNANVSRPFHNKFTFPYSPKGLNFAVEGNLTIDSKTFDDIILAQGRSGARNNWWFGGLHCSHPSFQFSKIEQLDCTATDGTDWCFIRGAAESGYTAPNHVKVKKRQCSDDY